MTRRMAASRMIAAVDIGTSKTATAIADVSESRGIYIHSIASVPTEGMSKGQVRDLNAVGMSIYKSFSQAAHTVGDVPDEVFLSISGGSIETYDYSVKTAIENENGAVSEDDVEKLARMIHSIEVKEGARLIDAIPQYYSLDDLHFIPHPVGMCGKELSLSAHIVTGSQSHIRNIENAVERTGLSIRGFILAVFGSASAVLKGEETSGNVLVVDFGGGTTDIAILVGGHLKWSAVIPVGGSHVEADLVHGLGISRDEASRIKFNYGRIRENGNEEISGEFVDIKRIGKRDYEKIPKEDIYSIIEPRLEELIELIDAGVMESGLKESIGGGAILVGGGANVRGFRKALSRKLGIPVRIGCPEGYNHLSEANRTPEFATVVGMLRCASRFAENEEEVSGVVGYLKAGWEYLLGISGILSGEDGADARRK